MKQTLVVWAAVALIIGCLFVVPYGYTAYTIVTTFQPASLAIEPQKMKIRQPWTLVGYRFLFAIPYNSDPKEDAFWNGTNDQHQHNSVEYDDMGIGWHLVFIECATVILITGAFLFTLRPDPVAKRP